MRPIVKRALHWGGGTLAVAGIVFVALRLRGYSGEIDFARFDFLVWASVAGIALIYGFSNLMLALAWWNLLAKFGANTHPRWAVRAYGASQIAKYVPGNIFQLAGRQAMGMAAGVSGWPLAKSAIWELGLIALAGTLFGLLALPVLVPVFSVTETAGMFAVTIALALSLLLRFFGLPVARAFGWYVGFLAISALLFVGLIELLVENPGPWVKLGPPLAGAYVLAWLVGLVTPGAPAGVGVRELMLLLLLKGVVMEADLLLVVTMGRLITVVGDLGFFGITRMLKIGI